MTQNALAFTVHGPQDAPNLIFLHGGGAAGWMWRGVVERLPEFRCLVPDLPGHGESRAIGPFNMALAAEKTAQLIREQARGGRAVVVGLSEGAQAAVQLLADFPEVVESALISSALLRPLPGMGWVASEGLLRWTYRLSVAPLRGSDFWIRLNMKYAAGLPEAYFSEFKAAFQQMGEDDFVFPMLANQRFRLPAGLEKVSVPVLAVAGRKEYAAMRQSARDLEQVLPNGRAALLDLGPKASLAQEHNWACTTPDLFARALRAWVLGAPLPSELSEFTA